MRLGFTILFLILVLVPISGFAERERAGGTLRTSRAPKPSPWVSALELRPSFPVSEDKAYGENLAELGVQVSPKAIVGYRQEFSNNYYNNDPTLEDGPQLKLADGFLFAKIGNLWRSGATSFSLEPRFYVPTDELLRQQGMITRIRTHFDLSHAFSRFFSIHWIEAPIIHVYDKSGSGSETDGFVANPSFENRFSIAQEIKLARSVALWLPIRLQSKRYSDFNAQAKNNNQWIHNVTLNPELTFALSSAVMVGAAFETANLMTEDLARFQINEGFSSGRSQLIFRLMF